MVAALVLAAYVHEREVREVAHEVHGHLPGLGEIFGAALAAYVGRCDGVVARGFLDDDLRRGYVGAYADDVLDGALYGGYRDAVVHYLAVGGQAFDHALDLADVGGDVLGDVGHDLIGQAHAELRGLVADYGRSGLEVGRLHVGHQTSLKAGAQAVIQQAHFHRRPVGGDDYLVAVVVKVVESVEKFLLRALLSGDELDMFQQTANTLPALYEQREWAAQASVQVLERPDMMAGYQNIFIAITLIVAMFMGCTFNAMNIISEKEDGVALINEILPMTHRQYMMQKIFVGFVFGCLSAILTAAICFRLSFTGAAVMLALIVLSAFVSALIGLFVGKLSDGMMVGVVYIKIVMIVFMAVPILNYLVGAGNKVLSYICYLIPSSATFEGIMDLANGTASTAVKDIVILTLHCVLWFLFYLLVSKRQKKHI